LDKTLIFNWKKHLIIQEIGRDPFGILDRAYSLQPLRYNRGFGAWSMQGFGAHWEQ